MMSYDIAGYLRVAADLLEHDESFATVTLLAVRGSAPQIAGAKAIVTEQGIVAGTVGGGEIDLKLTVPVGDIGQTGAVR